MAGRCKRYTKEEINAALAPRGIELIGEYKGITVKTEFKGACGHTWPATPNDVKNTGTGCRVCSGRDQTPEAIAVLLSPRGIELIRPLKRMKDKHRFKHSCGHEWDATLDSVKRGAGCPACAGFTHTIESLNATLIEQGRPLKLVEGFKGTSKPAKFLCLTCGEHWSQPPDAVIRQGNGCPHCANAIPLRAEDVARELLARGIKLTGAFKGVQHRAEYECATCGHPWSAHFAGVYYKKSGCPKCAKYGGLNAVVSFVYVMSYSNGLTKIGITNEPLRRLSQLRKATREEITLTALYQFGDGTGRAAYAAEQTAHKHFAAQHAGLNVFDGSTELFYITPAAACEHLRQAGGRVVELEEI